jgi:hypothetical protein
MGSFTGVFTDGLGIPEIRVGLIARRKEGTRAGPCIALKDLSLMRGQTNAMHDNEFPWMPDGRWGIRLGPPSSKGFKFESFPVRIFRAFKFYP